MNTVITCIYCIIIAILIFINIMQLKHRKKIEKQNTNVKLSLDFTGNDLKQLQNNYKILSKMLDDINLKADELNEKIDK